MTHDADPAIYEGPSRTPRAPRPAAPDDVWEAVRTEYLAGVGAPALCRRFGVGLSTLRDRAAREGWRRVDQPWTPPNRLDPEDEGVKLEEASGGDLDQVSFEELAYVAQRRMMRAVMRGDAGEALRWRRVRLALEEERVELDRVLAQEESVRRYYASLPVSLPSASDGSDASDGVSAPPAAASSDGSDASDGVSAASGPCDAPPPTEPVV